MREESIIKFITRQLQVKGRYFVNVHGSNYSRNGTADILTLDKSNRFLAIEAKVPGKHPVVNQWSHAIKVLQSGGRVVIAYDDFDIEKVDNQTIPTVRIGSVLGQSEFDAVKTVTLSGTTEICI